MKVLIKPLLFLVVLMIISIFCMHFTQELFAQTSVNTLTVEPQSKTVNKGEVIESKILLNAPQNTDISGFDLVITYDKNVLQAATIVLSPQFDIELNNSNIPGRIRMVKFNSTDTKISGTIELAKIQFKARARGRTAVTISPQTITALGAAGFLVVQVTPAQYSVIESNAETNTCNLCLGKSICLCWFIPRF